MRYIVSIEVTEILGADILIGHDDECIEEIMSEYRSGISVVDCKVYKDDLHDLLDKIVGKRLVHDEPGYRIVPDTVDDYDYSFSYELPSCWGADKNEPWNINLTLRYRCEFSVVMPKGSRPEDVVKWLSVNSYIEADYMVTIRHPRNRKLSLTTHIVCPGGNIGP